MQNNCAFVNIISSTGASIRDSLHNAGDVEEEGKCLKEEEQQLHGVIDHMIMYFMIILIIYVYS